MSHQEVAAESHHDDDDGIYLWNGTERIRDNKTITRVRVDNTITVIHSHAFWACVNLREVQLPTGLTRLDDTCFCGCKSLKQIYLPDSIEEIGQYAFWHSSLEEVKIPRGVSEIGVCVFESCSSLVNVRLHENVTQIGEYCFSNCSSLRTIELPTSLREIGYGAFDASGLEQLCLPANVSIGEDAFLDCKQLKMVIFPQSMGGIQNDVFLACQNICSFHLPTSTPTKESKFTATEQKLITELCRKDGQSAMDRLGMGWKRFNYIRSEKDNNSTVQTTCLFSFLKQNDFRILKNKKPPLMR